MWLSSPHLTSIHGFSQRNGGKSLGAYSSLNLSSRVGDELNHVLENRAMALSALGLENASVALLRQIHSSLVVEAATVLARAEPTAADAIVTNQANIALIIETADCYPVLLEDSQARVIAAAHCGWRGTAARILEKTILEMVQLGAKIEHLRVAIGPGICAGQYPVRLDVLEQFIESGFPLERLVQEEAISESGSRLFHLDIAAANRWLLESLGVPAAQIWSAQQCSTATDYFSYRRDSGQTGRMWNLICQK